MPREEWHDINPPHEPILGRGTAVGKYVIEERAAVSGAIDVYRAEDTRENRPVLLKFLRSDLSTDEDSKTRFRRAARAAARVTHENIVPVLEVADFRGRPFFAEEYSGAQPLSEFVRDGALSLTAAIDIGRQTCAALQAAHREGLFHGELGPDAVMIDFDGRCRLCGFGLAAVAGDDRAGALASANADYRSPEAVMGKETDARSDLFSLGVLMYEMITGRKPFDRGTGTTARSAVTGQSPEPLSQRPAGVPETVARIIAKLLEKDPAYRYQTASAVIADFKQLAAAKGPATGGPVDWWNRYVVVGAVIILLLIALWWLLSEFGIITR